MNYETKNIVIFHVICVKVSSKSRCSRTLPMNVAIERERERTLIDRKQENCINKE